MTAKFVGGEKTFYFYPNYYHPGADDEAIGGRFHLIKSDGTRTYIDIDYPNEEPGEFTLKADGSGMYSAILYQPRNQGSEPYGWGVYDQDGKSLGSIDSDCLNLNKSLYDKYPSGTQFHSGEIYVGSGASGGSHIITIIASRWTGSGWNQDVQGSKVGFSKNNMSEWGETITASAGEVITIHAKGADGFHQFPDGTKHWYYKVAGFYNASHVPYKVGAANNSGIDSYTFTVDGDRTIYVEFQYISQ